MRMPISQAFDVTHVAQRLSAGNGGYEIVHYSPGLEIGVYVLVAPEPDRQQPHEWDEVYVVLRGGEPSPSKVRRSRCKRVGRPMSKREPSTASPATRV